MKKKLAFLFLIIIAIFALVFFSRLNEERVIKHATVNSSFQPTILKQGISSQKIIKRPSDSSTTDKRSTDECQGLKIKYEDLNGLKKAGPLNERFENLHYQIDGVVYRIRKFYKETSEGEQLKYIVFKESSEDEINIIETNSYKPGKIYSSIKNNRNKELLYKEEGFSLKSNNFFLHYVNNKLTSIKNEGISSPQDCNFTSSENNN